MKLITKDFQILKGTHEFEFPVGITVIQGKNGSGKTTLFNAIEYCLVNPPGVDDAINWNAKQASVTIENNEEITWTKTKTSSEYMDSSGKVYTKASKINSTDLGDLGFYIKDDDVVNIQSSWKIIFPFGLKDTEMFKLFEDIFNISNSFIIMDDQKREEQEIKSNINFLNNQLNELTIKNQKIDEIFSKIDRNKINSFIEQKNQSENNLNQLKKDFEIYSNNQKISNLKVPEPRELINNQSVEELKRDFQKYVKIKSLINLQPPESKSFNIKENIYKEDYDKYLNLKNEINNYSNKLIELETEYNKVKEELKEIKVCPTCGQPLRSTDD